MILNKILFYSYKKKSEYNTIPLFKHDIMKRLQFLKWCNMKILKTLIKNTENDIVGSKTM